MLLARKFLRPLLPQHHIVLIDVDDLGAQVIMQYMPTYTPIGPEADKTAFVEYEQCSSGSGLYRGKAKILVLIADKPFKLAGGTMAEIDLQNLLAGARN